MLFVLLARERRPGAEPASETAHATHETRPKREWSRAEVLRHPIFYALLPGVLAGAHVVSALAPGVIGVLLDAGVGLGAQLLTMALYTVAAAGWVGVLVPRLDKVAAE